MKIRRATPLDVPSICEMHNSSIRELCRDHYSRRQIDDWVGALKPEGYVKAMEALEFMLADEEDIVVQSIFDPEKAELRALYVSPLHAGQGIGMALITEVEALSREDGIFELHLNSTLNAVHFYERIGFVREHFWSYILPCGTMLPCVRMSKKLTR
jgi:GNAT superfamily N-acetyltransferase